MIINANFFCFHFLFFFFLRLIPLFSFLFLTTSSSKSLEGLINYIRKKKSNFPLENVERNRKETAPTLEDRVLVGTEKRSKKRKEKERRKKKPTSRRAWIVEKESFRRNVDRIDLTKVKERNSVNYGSRCPTTR